ncbi:DNA-binding protein [uncultured Ilyobacter sp.]|uniref:DNA-binding protein n=1 Tax=uncultured Ilyobacter sp. TaxID=544433 RepID=UPI002AA75149|nr:DNA-binding protein [uncultured Ilyobacter sp.]
MGKDLTVSQIDRQNILNNPIVIKEVEKAIGMQGFIYENEIKFTKKQISEFYEVDERTIERYVEKNSDEIGKNGYEVLRGQRLKTLREELKKRDVSDIGVGDKAPAFGIYNFRTFLNIGMLLTESEKAKELRSAILDIVIDTINQKTGGSTKYVNQRDEEFIISYFKQEDYRKEFTDALKDCIDMGNFKYPLYTDKIYVSIFNEKSREYRKILKLNGRDNIRDTMYSEILDIISSYECGFADELRKACESKGRKLKSHEVDELFHRFETMALFKPLREKARLKMASRDLAFRDALHKNLKEYISVLPPAEFERFLGEKSKELSERLEDYKDEFKRLKERE